MPGPRLARSSRASPRPAPALAYHAGRHRRIPADMVRIRCRRARRDLSVSSPLRAVVQAFSEAPKAMTQSASEMTSAPASVDSVPKTPMHPRRPRRDRGCGASWRSARRSVREPQDVGPCRSLQDSAPASTRGRRADAIDADRDVQGGFVDRRESGGG